MVGNRASRRGVRWHWLGPGGEEGIGRDSRNKDTRGQVGLGCFKIDLEREWQVGRGPQESRAAPLSHIASSLDTSALHPGLGSLSPCPRR